MDNSELKDIQRKNNKWTKEWEIFPNKYWRIIFNLKICLRISLRRIGKIIIKINQKLTVWRKYMSVFFSYMPQSTTKMEQVRLKL